MQVEYRPHAIDRMLQRQVSMDEVEAVLSTPDGTIRQSEDKVVCYKEVAGREDNLLAVVAVERDGGYEVVTVMSNFEVGQ